MDSIFFRFISQVGLFTTHTNKPGWLPGGASNSVRVRVSLDGYSELWHNILCLLYLLMTAAATDAGSIINIDSVFVFVVVVLGISKYFIAISECLWCLASKLIKIF